MATLLSFWQLTFYKRVQILLMLFILLPIFIVSVISYFIITREVTDRIRESNAQVVRAVGADLAQAIDDVTFVANYFASDGVFHDALFGLRDTDRLNSFSDYTHYNRITDSFNLIHVNMLHLRARMFLVNPRDFMISSGYYTMPEMQRDWSWINDRIDYTNTSTMQWLGRSDSDEEFGDYMVARVIRHPDTHVYLGTLIIGLPKTYFDQTFEVITVGQVTLSDRNRTVVAQFASELFTSGQVAISEQHVNARSWTIQHQISSNEITGRITSTFLMFIVYVAAGIVLLLIISVVMAKRLNRPLNAMMQVAHTFGSGNLTVRFHARGKDEFAVLGGAFNAMLDQIQTLIANIETEQEEKRVIELQALFAQIRPHFLINTLNSMKLKMVMNGDHAYSRGLDSLMGLLRAYMRVHEPWTLQEECRMIEQYLEVMQLRTDHAVELELEVADHLRGFTIPRLLLQPIVENAVVHGFSERDSDARIGIHAVEGAESEVIISISDNGKGMSEAECETLIRVMNSTEDEVLASYDRVGLINIAQRVRLTYGRDSSITVTRNDVGGVTFTLRLQG